VTLQPAHFPFYSYLEKLALNKIIRFIRKPLCHIKGCLVPKNSHFVIQEISGFIKFYILLTVYLDITSGR